MQVQQMAGHMIRRLHQTSSHVFSERMHQAGFDLTPVQFAAMEALHTNPGIDQAGVAALIAYDRATIGGVIDRLEKKGLIVRTVSTRDRRARDVRLSPKGEQTITDMLPVVIALQDDILTGLAPAEREQFLHLAAKALKASEA